MTNPFMSISSVATPPPVRQTRPDHAPDRVAALREEALNPWEPGTRFIGLHMTVTYPMEDDRNDVQEALALVGCKAASGPYTARVYTDGGTTSDYALTVNDEPNDAGQLTRPTFVEIN